MVQNKRSIFFPVSCASVKKDLSIIEDSLMGSVFSTQSGFQFIFKNIRPYKVCDRK